MLQPIVMGAFFPNFYTGSIDCHFGTTDCHLVIFQNFTVALLRDNAKFSNRLVLYQTKLHASNLL